MKKKNTIGSLFNLSGKDVLKFQQAVRKKMWENEYTLLVGIYTGITSVQGNLAENHVLSQILFIFPSNHLLYSFALTVHLPPFLKHFQT